MPFRLVIGLIKGLLLGAVMGWGLAAAGFAVPGALIAYPAAAVAGAIVALVAGKPIWAKGARIEVGLKAGAGALLAPGFMFAARQWLTVGVPFDLSSLPGLASATGELALGTFIVTSLAMIGGLLAAFYDADHQPGAASDNDEGVAGKKRIAAQEQGLSLAELEAAEAEAESVARKQKR